MGVESSGAGGSGSCNSGGGSIDGIDTISRGVEAVKNNREISKKKLGQIEKNLSHSKSRGIIEKT